MSRIEIYDSAIEEMAHDPDGPVADIITRAAYAVENEAKRKLLEPGTGRVYTKRFYYDSRGLLHTWGSRPAHQASAPGEPAASDTGQLVNSVGHRIEDGAMGIEAHVGSPLKHAAYTELGTRFVPPPKRGMPGHHGMVERPWLRPSLDVLRITPLS